MTESDLIALAEACERAADFYKLRAYDAQREAAYIHTPTDRAAKLDKWLRMAEADETLFRAHARAIREGRVGVEDTREMLEERRRWAPREGEKFVRMADELVAQLRAAPSEHVRLQVRDDPDGTLSLQAERC